MVLGSSQQTERFCEVVVRRNYGSSRIVNFMDFGECVKTSRSGVVLYKSTLLFSGQ